MRGAGAASFDAQSVLHRETAIQGSLAIMRRSWHYC
jgi:hypothetical protein